MRQKFILDFRIIRTLTQWVKEGLQFPAAHE
jgi:hypothetical protein